MNENDKNNIFYDNLLKAFTDKLSVQAEVQQNDRRLENIVMYKLTEGFTNVTETNPTIITDDIDRYREVLEIKEEFKKNFEKMFKEFKLAIKRKSITLEELELKVFSEYGLVSEDHLKMANPIKDDIVEFMSEENYINMRKSIK